MLSCCRCGNEERNLFLHDGELLCRLCLMPRDGDRLAAVTQITRLRAEGVREELKRKRGE